MFFLFSLSISSILAFLDFAAAIYFSLYSSKILLFCNYSTKAIIYEFNGLYDPKYLNLNPKDENSW